MRQERENAADQIKASLRFGVQQRAEIMSLRRKDQQENLQRKHDFDRLIQAKLAREVSEKLKRAEAITGGMSKLKDLTLKKRAEFRGFIGSGS